MVKRGSRGVNCLRGCGPIKNKPAGELKNTFGYQVTERRYREREIEIRPYLDHIQDSGGVEVTSGSI